MPRTGRATTGNLPAETTSFVGRRRHLREVKRQLAGSRLVTLTGVGGTGKTRLALHVAAELKRAFPDGVWFVDLTELHEPALLTQEVEDPGVLAFLVGAALGLRQAGGPPVQVLVEQLADRQMLLVLDNCEHLLPACAILADAMLRGCPGLRVLATSREPLILSGERLYSVPPLPAPDPEQPPNLAEVSQYESVALFVARAAAAAPDFELTEANHRAVADLCYHLDGLPLAIELAAAQIRVLATTQILERLTDRFTLLSNGSRGAPERQQTLRACVDWSFELCAKPERLLWARVSVFAGGFELDAAEGICADEKLPEADVLDSVASLVDKSILISDGQAAPARYRLLETIRDYGEEKLIEAGDDAALRRRHRDWHQQLVARAGVEWVSDRQAYWMERLGREHSNLRTAMEYDLTEPDEAESALRMMVTLPGFYWLARGLFGEGRSWLDRALAKAIAPTSLRARALLVDSHLAVGQGDIAAAMRRLGEGEELAGRLDATAELAYAAFIRGTGALFANNLPVAVETLERAQATLSRVPEPDVDQRLHLLTIFGVAAGLAGDQDRASACQQEMLGIVERRGETFHRSIALWVGGIIAWRRQDLSDAAAQVLESLRLKREWASHDRYGIALCLEVLAWITADQGHHRRAAALLGAADGLLAESGASITAFGHFVGHHAACEGQARAGLGDRTFAAAVRRGQALTLDDLLAYALDESSEPAPAPPQAPSTPLTRREEQIAELVGQGLTSKDMAARLLISPRTVESHVEHILTKLGLTNRSQIAAWVGRRPGDAR